MMMVMMMMMTMMTMMFPIIYMKRMIVVSVTRLINLRKEAKANKSIIGSLTPIHVVMMKIKMSREH